MLNVSALDNSSTDANNQTAYQRFRFDLISMLEAVRPAAYLDSKSGSGIPTIGIGFNLRDDNILKLVLDAFGVDVSPTSTAPQKFHDIVAKSYASNAALQAALDAEMAKQHNANPVIRSTFAFSGGDVGLTEMRAVFDTAVMIYDEGYPSATAPTDRQGRVNAWLSGIPDSYERAVLVSMSYNGYINEGNYSPSLRDAIVSGDRAEAWFQIRYDSNRLAKHYLTGTLTAAETAANGSFTKGEDRGVAKRHFVEADVFGLYRDSNNVTLAEAKQAYQMLQKHREYILKYEAGYGQTPEGLTGTRGDMIAAANNNSAIVMNIVGVSTLLECFDPACTVILDDLSKSTDPSLKAAYDAWATNNRAGFVSTDLYFGSSFSGALDASLNEGAAGRNDVLIVDDTAPVRNWILQGGKGDDLLIGGSGDDVLYGGAGNDVMAGGAGNDTYMLDGGGHDTIEDKLGNNRVFFNGKALANFSSADGVNYVSYEGDFTAVLNNGDFIVTDLVSGDQVTLNKNFQTGDFGITLSDVAGQPTPPGATTHDIVGDPLIHSATIAPGSEGADWRVLKTYNWQYAKVDTGNGNLVTVLASYDVDYFLVEAGGNPVEGGGPVRDDLIVDTTENDRIVAGGGNDRITLMQGGDDIVDAGAGDDLVINKAASGNVTIDLGDGADRFKNYGAGDTLNVSAGAGRDMVEGGAGDDLIQGNMDGDVLAGGAGNDRLFGDSEVTTEQAILNGNSDVPNGLQGEWLSGNGGDDTLVAGAGNDVLCGGGGKDLLIAGAGDDYIMGDTDWDATSLDWTVTKSSGVTWFDPVSGIDDPADSGADVIYAGAGNDTVWAGAGNDIVYGEGGQRQIRRRSGRRHPDGGAGRRPCVGRGR